MLYIWWILILDGNSEYYRRVWSDQGNLKTFIYINNLAKFDTNFS